MYFNGGSKRVHLKLSSWQRNCSEQLLLNRGANKHSPRQQQEVSNVEPSLERNVYKYNAILQVQFLGHVNDLLNEKSIDSSHDLQLHRYHVGPTLTYPDYMEFFYNAYKECLDDLLTGECTRSPIPCRRDVLKYNGWE